MRLSETQHRPHRKLKGLFRNQVLTRQKYRLVGEVNLTRSPMVRWLALLLCGVTAISILYLCAGEYSRRQQVSGHLQPTAGLVRMQFQSEGIITKFYVKDGDYVESGSPLLEVSSHQFDGNSNELTVSLLQQSDNVMQQLELEISQLKEQQTMELLQIASEITSLEKQLAEQKEQQRMSAERLLLQGKVLDRMQNLSSDGFISQLEINKQQDLLLQLRQQDRSLNATVLALREKLEASRANRRKMPLQHSQAIAVAQQKISQQQSRQTELQHQSKNVMTAPVSGVVSAIQFKTGHQVKTGQSALTLVPQNQQLEAVLYIPTAAIGFVANGQEARLRYHAYPYQRFGIAIGHITEVSDTVVLPSEMPELVLASPCFRIKVTLPSQAVAAYGRQLPLKAGMTVEADVITERRTLLQWLFDPIYSLYGRVL